MEANKRLGGRQGGRENDGNPMTYADPESEKAHQAMQHGVRGSNNYPTITPYSLISCLCLHIR